MKWLFGKDTQPQTSLRITSSIQGQPITIFLGGQMRLSGNILWANGFNSSGSSSGKGGMFSGPSSSSPTYSVSFIMSLCHGLIASMSTVWNSKAISTIADLDLAVFYGDYAQSAWDFVATTYPGQDRTYRGQAYIGAANFNLGSSAEIPQLSVEVLHTNANAIPGIPDANPAPCLIDFLTNQYYGVGFPTARMGTLANYGAYALAVGLVVSPAITANDTAQNFCNSLLQGTNSQARWSSGILDVVPYGDKQITVGAISMIDVEEQVPSGADINGNYTIQPGSSAAFVADISVVYHGSGIPLTSVPGSPAAGQYAVTQNGLYYFSASDANAFVDITFKQAAQFNYTPNNEPIYDFDDDNFLPNQGSLGTGNIQSPLTVVRKRKSDMLTTVKVEYLDRNNQYNPVVIDHKDEATITTFKRERTSDLRAMHFFANAVAASQSASLQLVREQIARTYNWTAGRRYILLDVLDIVTVSDPGQNIYRQLVRITEIQENTDRTLTFTAEEVPGTASAPEYGRQASTGYGANYNEAPGPVNQPILFEPSDELGGGLQVWGAISGSVPATWGGCNVLASYDGITYEDIGSIRGASRMGATTNDLPIISVNPTGQTIDQTNTLDVDLTESAGALATATTLDATSLNTACYIGGEIIAYATATLLSAYKYRLAYLVRGAYGTESAIVDHPIGTQFARLDQGIFKLGYDQSRVGSKIYLKFQSFNLWGAGLEDVSTLTEYNYTLTGSALASPLPDVQKVRVAFSAGFQEIWWDDVQDFRSGIRYKIFKGDSFSGSQQVGDNAHAPFIAFGPGTYWIQAYCQPVASLFAYSETPSSIEIAGNMIIANLLYTSDQQTAGWPGIFSNGVGVDGSNIRLGGSGNILTDADFLNTPDILNYGGIIASGTYEISSAYYVNTGYVGQNYINLTWASTGVPVGQNILTIPDILSTPDILGAASAQYVNVIPQIATSITGPGDIFAAADVFDTSVVPDAFSYGYTWSDWQDYVPGVYLCQYVKFRLVLSTVDPNTIAYALAFAYQVSVPARIDHYQNLNVGSGGMTITFTPDSQDTVAPFNGGPPLGGINNSPLPFVNFSVTNQPNINPVIDSLTLAALTFHYENSSGPIAATDVNVTVEGY